MESGENPELTRSGIGERRRHGLSFLLKGPQALYREIWEAVAVGERSEFSRAPESEDLPEFCIQPSRNKVRDLGRVGFFLFARPFGMSFIPPPVFAKFGFSQRTFTLAPGVSHV